jgi:hypothetical protein
MDQQRLDEIRERCEAATKGPWEAVNKSVRLAGVVCKFSWGNEAPDGYNGGICNCLGASYGAKKNDPVNEQARGNAAFIAASRTDVPDLLNEVERLQADRDAWRRRAEAAEKRCATIAALPSCNDCKDVNSCGKKSRLGDWTRINCPLWRGPVEGGEDKP